MHIISFSLVLAFLLAETAAQAEPRMPISGPKEAHVILVQNASGDSWRSPSSLSSEFPRLEPTDCSRYGAQYNYAECRGARERRQAVEKPAPAAQTPPKPAIQVTVAAQQAPRIQPPQAKAKPTSLIPKQSNPVKKAALPPPPIQTLSVPPAVQIKPDAQSDAIKRMVGQLLIVGFEGKQVMDLTAAQTASALKDGRLGGVLIRAGNVESFTQLQNLLTQFQRSSQSTPPLIAAEQPGGPHTAFSDGEGFSAYASARTISGDNQPYFAQLLYRDMATELANLGINMNIGPSADICPDSTPTLSAACFSGDPRQVNVFATAFNYGHNERGVLTALQHTPFTEGLQSTSFYKKASAAIFRELTKRRPSDALVVQVKSADQLQKPAFPAQTNTIRGLKENIRDLGYDGALIFDLDFVNRGGPVRYDEAVVSAFEAGADMVLLRDVSNVNGDISVIAFEAVNQAVQSGRIQLSRIEDAAQNVRRLKERLTMWQREAKSASATQSADERSATP